MRDLGKDEEVGKNGDARQRGNIGKDTKIRSILKKKKRNILACGKTYALSCCLRQGGSRSRQQRAWNDSAELRPSPD